MSPVRIVTDGAADLPDGVAEALGIRVVRGPVHLNGSDWHGTIEEFWRAVRAGDPAPSTAPPGREAFAEAFAGTDSVCAVLVSSELSRTVEHAKEAAGGEQHVHVVDSRSLSVGTGLVAAGVARTAALDADFDEVKRLARQLVDEVHLHAVIDDVDYLLRGGRAGLVDAHAKRGSRYVVAVKGHVIPLDRAKDRAGAIRRLIDHLADHVPHGIGHWAVGHGAADDVEEFTAQVEERLGRPPEFVVSLGPSVGAHAGPGALVVGFLTRPA
ncbi:MAG: DegV family EDD domain-containing protein [Actinobacteria bacterium]|nr:DegV family EDD domain-containing protein [Actinomycetota bacterium]